MIGLYKDISNYLYTKKCFRLICEDISLIKTYKPRVTPLGVLYIFYRIPTQIDEKYHNDVISQNMQFMDASLTAMGLTGIVEFECRYIDTDEENQDFVYLIKFKPIFNYISWYYIVKWFLICTIFILLLLNLEQTLKLIKTLL